MKTNKRRGFSLIEVSAVLGVSTVIAGMAVWLVHVSMQKSRDGQRHLNTQNTVARLAETWRSDAHAAATIAEEKTGKQVDAGTAARSRSAWLLTLASGRVVRYQLEPGRLIRSEYTSPPSGNEDPQKPSSQDSFELPADVVISIRLEPPSEPRIASLLITPPDTVVGDGARPTSPTPRIHPLRIDAALSTDARFEKVATQNNKKAATPKETKK